MAKIGHDYKAVGDAQELRDVIPQRGEGKERQAFYSSPEALARQVLTIKPGDTYNPGCSCFDSSSASHSFTGAKSLEHAAKMALDGWQDGAARAERLRDKINTEQPTGPRLVRWDVAGAYPSIGRALSGNPMNMKRIDAARLRRRPVITLLSDMSCNADKSAESMINRAGVVAAIIDAVESAGFACAVVGFAQVRAYDGAAVALVAATLKESSAPADIARLAYGLGHAAMFRRLIFASMCEDRHVKGLGLGLGQACALNRSGLSERGVYVLPSIQDCAAMFRYERDAESKGLAHLLKTLRAQGCPAFANDDRAAA